MENYVVIHPFGDYLKGQMINDEDEMLQIMEADQMGNVVRTNIEEAE